MTIKVVNGKKMAVEGKGNIKIVVIDNKKQKVMIILNNVLYVPQLTKNLLSIHEISKESHRTSFTASGSYIEINSKSKRIVPMNKFGQLY